MRLVELNPKWVEHGGEGVSDKNGNPIPRREGIGIIFDCPCGCGQALYVDLANPRDGKGPERDDGHVWQNTWGEIRDERDYFETLTLHPSILRSKDHGGCGWHGWVRNGEIVNA